MAGRTAAGILLMLVLCEIVSGCASVAPVAYSEVASSAYLAPNPSDSSGRVPYRYAAPVEWRLYDKVTLDPVVVYRGRDNQFGEMSERDKAALAAYMRTRFQETLSTRFTVTNSRAPNTLRVRLTLTGAVANTPVLGTLSRFDLAGAVYNGVQTARDGEGSMTGSVIYVVEVFDAPSGRLLSAFLSASNTRPPTTSRQASARSPPRRPALTREPMLWSRNSGDGANEFKTFAPRITKDNEGQ
jgi:hypothetical protein